MKTIFLFISFISSIALAAQETPQTAPAPAPAPNQPLSVKSVTCSNSKVVRVYSEITVTGTDVTSLLKVNDREIPFQGCFGDSIARPNGRHLRCVHRNSNLQAQVYPDFDETQKVTNVKIILWRGQNALLLQMEKCP